MSLSVPIIEQQFIDTCQHYWFLTVDLPDHKVRVCRRCGRVENSEFHTFKANQGRED